MSPPPKDLWDDPVGLVAYYTTRAIPINPNPGILVASVVVSVLGSYATLLLLGRRTSSRGWRNHLLLIAAAICFACVAVWGMHFVGMMCIRLDASPTYVWYVQFSKGMTALSLFVPLISTTFAFWFAGSEREVKAWRVISAGVFAGLTIVFMHYSASFTLPFLRVSYTAVTVVFAIIIACVAAVVALFAFFTFRAQWEDSFWKRCLCSLVLATAVCGMHYLGVGGTSYRTKPNVLPALLTGSRTQNVRLTISISALCGAIILLSICLAALDLYTRRRVRAQARHIAVASLAFDQYGKMLVKADGTVPLQMIETGAALSSVLAELDPRQPTFQWMYSLSFNWHLLKPFVPRIFASITNRTLSELRDAERDQTVAAAFRSRFLEASVLLAQQLNLSVEALGMLFDRVLTTGTRSPRAAEPHEKVTRDDESSIHGITLRLQASEGVVLFLCRQIDNAPPSSVDYPASAQGSQASVDKVEAWLQKGWRLADTRFYSRTLADHLGVSKPEMDIFLSACKTYAKRANRPVVQTTGTYLGLFGVRPHPSHGLDVLVYNFARHQIPAYRLPDIQYPITAGMKAWIRECSGCTMAEVLHRATTAVQQAEAHEDSSHSSRGDEIIVEFQASIAVAIDSLTTALRSWPYIHDLARLSPEVLELPASSNDDQVPAQMIVLEVILPAPAVRLSPVQSRASGVQAPQLISGRQETDKPPAPFVYTPWSLFAKSQNTLIRGKLWVEACKMMGNDLLRLYPPMSSDLALETMDDEKPIVRRGITNPFSDKHRRPNDSVTMLSRKAVSEKHGRRGSVPSVNGFAPSELSVAVDDEKHSASGHGTAPLDAIDELSAPSAIDTRVQMGFTGHGVKRGLVTLKGVADPANVEDTTVKQAVAGEPLYAQIRDKLDGWYLRSMRTLERDDMGNQLDSYDWQSTLRGP